MLRSFLSIGIATVFLFSPLYGRVALSQSETKDEKKEEKKDDKRPEKKSNDNIKPYDDVITSKAKSEPGLFLVHQLDDKVFYEIPTNTFGKDILWVTQLERTQTGFGFAGSPLGHRVVRWEQRGENVLLREVTYGIRADATDPIHNAVEATSVESIIESFPVKAYGKDRAPVIEATSLFLSDLPEFSAKRRLNAASLDPKRSFIDKIKAFPENIETKVLQTYRLKDDRGGGAVTVMLHHSMVKLPDEPMRPRRFDDRVAFFTESFQDYGNVKN
ncbi:MAG TPA: DUF5117 domain-containing protein, partial [Isosphaeraceae bacterium]|nr:DUF5117 domain-containing protein [Isosphaeraceae bacterium]